MHQAAYAFPLHERGTVVHLSATVLPKYISQNTGMT